MKEIKIPCEDCITLSICNEVFLKSLSPNNNDKTEKFLIINEEPYPIATFFIYRLMSKCTLFSQFMTDICEGEQSSSKGFVITYKFFNNANLK